MNIESRLTRLEAAVGVDHNDLATPPRFLTLEWILCGAYGSSHKQCNIGLDGN